MSFKMQPFWWFLPPTASKLCFWSKCQTCTPWTVEAPRFTCEVDINFYMECEKSLRFDYTYEFMDISSCWRLITQCDDYYGVYLRANIATSGAGVRFRVNNQADNGYVEITFYNEPGVGIRYQIGAYKDGEGPVWAGPTYPYTNNSWIWFEVWDDPSTGVTTVYLDGVERSAGGRHVFLDTPMYYVLIQNFQSCPDFSFWVDFMRMFDIEEYPPSLELCTFTDNDGE